MTLDTNGRAQETTKAEDEEEEESRHWEASRQSLHADLENGLLQQQVGSLRLDIRSLYGCPLWERLRIRKFGRVWIYPEV